MGMDPVGFTEANPMSFNRYAYANNNPYKYVDPDGRSPALAESMAWGEAPHAWNAIKEGTKGGLTAISLFAGGGLGLVGRTAVAGKTGISAAKSGALEGANFAQKTYGKTFSATGKFAGQTVDDVASALKSGGLKPSDVPIDFIVRNGSTLILNTRSSQALSKAGIPRSQWNAVNRTGQKGYESRLSDQLRNNKLTDEGISSVRSSN